MKIKPNFELRKICREHIVIATGRENIDFTKVISLNESAAHVWNHVNGTEFTIDDMVSALTSEYEVSDEQARHDCETLIDQWQKAGLL